MSVTDTLYSRFQPVTWAVGVVDAPAERVARAVAARDPRSTGTSEKVRAPIEEALESLEPLGSPGKLLVASTADNRSGIFCNLVDFPTVAEYATWCAGEVCGSRGYFVLRIPDTIAPDQRSGKWGAIRLTIRDVENMSLVKHPTFEVGVLNDAGRWRFSRHGKVQPFEEPEAYHAPRVCQRFTEDALARYCERLGLRVWDPGWYLPEVFVVGMLAMQGDAGVTYSQARQRFRIDAPGSPGDPG